MHRGTQTLLTATAALCLCAALTAFAPIGAGAASKPSTTLTILVTNDDGVTAPGINATVQALSALPHTKVTVVAPLTNQSGTGAKVTAGTLTASDAWDLATPPIKTFLLKFAREKDIRLFVELSHSPPPAKPEDVSLTALVPAYVISELKASFQIGAVLFLPFLIIDLVVASITLSVGMVQLPPVMVSAPFKILLFVLVDGWNLVIGSLVRSFYS